MAKLVIKCIIFLEQTGVLVHGIVSDRAQTNRNMWSELEVDGYMTSLRYWFSYLLNNDNENIYIFRHTISDQKC